eukprot:TRINITY_DN68104_c0_g1_i8.p1 TRINITY_DN68104_c0_g1~~TRINITY_DN68104_c0_g1_i8.p1  ORF type:complete len:119 (+),score=19.79 TRINITY_DN68104_c0_g1_i8:463-819(+)
MDRRRRTAWDLMRRTKGIDSLSNIKILPYDDEDIDSDTSVVIPKKDDESSSSSDDNFHMDTAPPSNAPRGKPPAAGGALEPEFDTTRTVPAIPTDTVPTGAVRPDSRQSNASSSKRTM